MNVPAASPPSPDPPSPAGGGAAGPWYSPRLVDRLLAFVAGFGAAVMVLERLEAGDLLGVGLSLYLAAYAVEPRLPPATFILDGRDFS